MLKSNYRGLLEKVEAICTRLSRPKTKVVVVSKTRSVDQIMKIYEEGCRDFGENYVEELCQKAPHLPKDINWHFIGHLQSNKTKKLLSVPLRVLETIDRLSLAQKVNAQLKKQDRHLDVFMQVRTSEEERCTMEESIKLAQYIKNSCPNMRLSGLMTIGKKGDKEAFGKLGQLKTEIQSKLSLPSLQLSMGMSEDYTEAIESGSTVIRVGTLVFGPRPPKQPN